MKSEISFTLNNENVTVEVDNNHSLLTVLRHHFNKTGTKYSCGIGQCGACTVLINKKPERSCMIMMEDVQNTEVITIEGLSLNGTLHPMQEAFIEHDALQCGFCTPGMIMNAIGLVLEKPTISREEIIEGMEENLCRCGSYNRIVDAILTAANKINQKVKI
jgi:carbon-monoxide dehydrogenase small subunit